MAKLTDEQKAELAKLSPEDLVKKLDAQHEITDRYEARATGAEGKLTAAEKKAAEDVEAARLKDATETEKEKAARLKAEKALETERTERKRDKIASAVRLAALKLGAADPDDVIALMGTNGIELDDAGNPKGVDEAVTALKEKKPHLFGAAGNGWAGNEGHAGTGPGQRKGGALTMKRADWERLDPAQRAEFRKKGGVPVD